MLFSLTSPFLRKLRNNFFGKCFLLNGYVYFHLFIFELDFMAQDFKFVILNSFHSLFSADSVGGNQQGRSGHQQKADLNQEGINKSLQKLAKVDRRCREVQGVQDGLTTVVKGLLVCTTT